jgi:hypothetical protein
LTLIALIKLERRGGKVSENKTDASEETFQEGMTPVQAFTTRVMPADLPSESRLRRGRPPRGAAMAAQPKAARNQSPGEGA